MKTRIVLAQNDYTSLTKKNNGDASLCEPKANNIEEILYQQVKHRLIHTSDGEIKDFILEAETYKAQTHLLNEIIVNRLTVNECRGVKDEYFQDQRLFPFWYISISILHFLKIIVIFFNNLMVTLSFLECSGPLGMEGGVISNQQITASSTHRALFGLQKWYPYFARLNKKGLVNAWSAAENDRWPWIQVTDGCLKQVGMKWQYEI